MISLPYPDYAKTKQHEFIVWSHENEATQKITYYELIAATITFSFWKPPDRSNRKLSNFSHNFSIRAVGVEIFGYTATTFS